MKTHLSRTLLAVFAFAAVVLMIPGQALAAPWCDICDNTNDCFACCRCDGGTAGSCFAECGYPAAPSDETTLVSFSTCEPLMSVATPAEDTVETENTDAQPVEPTAAG